MVAVPDFLDTLLHTSLPFEISIALLASCISYLCWQAIRLPMVIHIRIISVGRIERVELANFWLTNVRRWSVPWQAVSTKMKRLRVT